MDPETARRDTDAWDVAIGYPVGFMPLPQPPAHVEPDPARALRDALRLAMLRPPWSWRPPEAGIPRSCSRWPRTWPRGRIWTADRAHVPVPRGTRRWTSRPGRSWSSSISAAWACGSGGHAATSPRAGQHRAADGTRSPGARRPDLPRRAGQDDPAGAARQRRQSRHRLRRRRGTRRAPRQRAADRTAAAGSWADRPGARGGATCAAPRPRRISRTAYPNRASAEACRPAVYRASGGTSAWR